MKRLTLILLLAILAPCLAVAQSTTENLVERLFNDLNQELGNLYLIDTYNPATKLEYIQALDDNIKAAIRLVKKRKMKYIELNYSLVKDRIEKNRILSQDQYAKLDDFHHSKFYDSLRLEKLFQFQSRVQNELTKNYKKGEMDSLLRSEDGLSTTSPLFHNYRRFYEQSRKKLWSILSVYESAEYYIVFSFVMAGNNPHTAINRADLILK